MNTYLTPIEDILDREFPQLKGHTYLDHAGSQLPPKSLIDSFTNDLNKNIYGNPHSDSTPSARAGHRIDEIRERALRFFGADPEEFDLIFVANATAAIKLVMDSFRDYRKTVTKPNLPKVFRKCFQPQFHYYYHRDAHTSLVGIREFSNKHFCFHNDAEVEAWIRSPGSGTPPLTLFAYPGQSNMTGYRLPLSWPAQLRSSWRGSNTFTLLDAAALSSTCPLNLSRDKPDFTAVSMYKIFGFPDLGALIVRKSTTAPILDARRYFGGGTVDMVISVDGSWHAKKTDSLHDKHEDGTLPFHNIIALGHAFNAMERVYGGMSAVSQHTSSLAAELYNMLNGLKHASSGTPLVEIYKDACAVYGDSKTQGATIAFNVIRADGTFVGYQDVERAADAEYIYVRSGGLCNPGGVATYLDWEPKNLSDAYRYGHRCSKPIQGVNGRATGVVRVSLGACSSRKDIRALVEFLKSAYLNIGEDVSVPISTDAVLDGTVSLPQHKDADIIVEERAAAPCGSLPTAVPPTPIANPSTAATKVPSLQDGGSQTTTLEVMPDEGSDKTVSTPRGVLSARRWVKNVLARKLSATGATVVTVEEVRV